MHPARAWQSLGLALALPAFFWQAAFANCATRPEGQIIEIAIKTCEGLVAETNTEVRKHAGSVDDVWNLKKAYTGALVTDLRGVRWMYPSSDPNPCARFPPNSRVLKRGYFTCCDTGRWGKCVFGGNWLGDLDGPPINSFQ